MQNLRYLKAIGTVSYVSTGQSVSERFSYSYAQMLAYNSKHLEKDGFIYYDRLMSSWLPRARNDLVKSLLGEWIFFLDADLEFYPDILEQMLRIFNKYQCPVLTGIYPYKKKPNLPVLYSWNERRKIYEVIGKWPQDVELFQVDAAGAGCLLIHNSVFHKIWEELKQDPFDVIGNNSEDMSFFSRLRKVGISVYATPQVKLSHLTTEGLSYDVNEITIKLGKSYER